MNRTIYIAAAFVAGTAAGALVTYVLVADGKGEEAATDPVIEDPVVEVVTDTALPEIVSTDDEVETDTEKETPERNDDLALVLDTTASDSTMVYELTFADSIATDIEDIIILEDRLVGSRQVDIMYLDGAEDDNLSSEADSALAAHLDIREDERPTSLDVEFWNSPINYAGYRLGKNKVILFGVAATDTIALYGREETVYLHTSAGLYELNRCDEFEQLRQIADEEFVSSIVDGD